MNFGWAIEDLRGKGKHNNMWHIYRGPKEGEPPFDNNTGVGPLCYSDTRKFFYKRGIIVAEDSTGRTLTGLNGPQKIFFMLTHDRGISFTICSVCRASIILYALIHDIEIIE